MPRSHINQIIVNLIGTARLVLVLLFVLAMLVFVWGMVKFIFAASNPEQLKKAKGILWWGIIGMFVLASVFGIVVALQTYFGIGAPRIPIPQFGPGGSIITMPSVPIPCPLHCLCNPPNPPSCPPT